jgi:hypothetical protein
MTIDEKIVELQSDVREMQLMQRVTERLDERNNEASEGSCMLSAIRVLLREAVMHYEEEIATLKGPEADA